MTIGYKPSERKYLFEVSEQEYESLIAGEKIVRITENSEYKTSKFTLSFKGKKRKEIKNGKKENKMS